MLDLLLGMLGDNAGHCPELVIGGVWECLTSCIYNRPALGRVVVDANIFAAAVASLRRVGGPEEWLSIARGHFVGGPVMRTAMDVTRVFAGEVARPDLEVPASLGHRAVDSDGGGLLTIVGHFQRPSQPYLTSFNPPWTSTAPYNLRPHITAGPLGPRLLGPVRRVHRRRERLRGAGGGRPAGASGVPHSRTAGPLDC